MSKLRELVEKQIELANLAITACGTDETSAYVHTRYRDRLKQFLEEDDKENKKFPVLDAELINKYDTLRMTKGMVEAIPEFARWVLNKYYLSDMMEFVEWRDKYFEEYLGRWEYIDDPDKGNWTNKELYQKFKTKTT